jgi:hypothetical protein
LLLLTFPQNCRAANEASFIKSTEISQLCFLCFHAPAGYSQTDAP